MIRFKKIDLLFFGYVIITTILLLLSWNESNKSLELLLTRVLIIIIGISLIYFDSKIKSTILNLLRNCYPILFSMLFYTETVFYNKLLFNNLDSYLISLENYLF